MTESESPRRVRITRSMLGRLAAVGLFLCLGTLAVMHTVTNRNSSPPKTDADTAEADSSPAPQGDPASTTALLASNPTTTNPAANTTQVASKTNPNLPTTTPLTAPPMTSGYPIPSSQSKPAISPAIMNAANRSNNPSAIPSSNASSTMRPPPAMSFSDASPKPTTSSALQLAGEPPIVSAQIQVESDDETSGDSSQQSTSPGVPSNNSLQLGNSPKSFGTNSAQTNDPPTLSGNPMRQSTGQANPGSVAPPLSSRPAGSATPYDPVGNSSSSKAFSQSTDDVAKSAERSISQNAGNANPTNSIGPSVLNSKPESNATNAPSKMNPMVPANSSQNGAPLRAANPTTANPASNFGTNSSQPRESFASSSRGFESSGLPPADSSRVQSTPGAASLEGPQSPSLKLQKIAPREVQINKPAELQLVVQNSGQVPAEQVVVHDRIPDGTELIDATPKANQSGDGTLSWNLGTIAPGETSKITINLMPRQPGEFGSVAQVTFAAQASARTLCTQPILGVTLTTKPKVLIGDEVFLDIVVENKGDGPATNVLLQEDVPELLTFEDGSRELEFEIGTLAPGQKRSVQLRLKAAKVGLTQNRIVAQGDAGLEVSDTAEMEIVAPELQASGDGPARKYLNRQATHEFAVSNAGTAPANNVDFVARLPRGLKFVSANNHGQYDANSNSVYWSLQQLATGQIGRVELVTVPIEPGDQKIDFEATADLNQKAVVSKSLFVEYLVELFCEIDDLTDPIEIGSETAYRIKVVNQGLQVATNIRLNVDFPPGIEPIGVSGSIAHQIQGQRVVFSALDRLDAQQETVVTITAKGTVEGDHRVVVSMSSDARETQIAKEESTQVYSDQR